MIDNRKASVGALAMFALAVLFTTPVIAQDRPSNPLPNTVWVGADGKFESDPDTALVQFNISAQDKNLQSASQKASQQAEQIRQLMPHVFTEGKIDTEKLRAAC